MAILLFVASLPLASLATAEQTLCALPITRTNVVACALRQSPLVRAAGYELAAARSRQVAASPLLPANPVLTVSGGRRNGSGTADVWNWYVTLAQELEVGGQRGVRRKAAKAAAGTQTQRLRLSRREVAAAAWSAFFDALAAREQQQLAARLAGATQSVATVARAKADQGLIAAVDADVAEFAWLAMLQAKRAADRRALATNAALASLLGLDAAKPLQIEGELVPLAQAETKARTLAASSPTNRPEILALTAEHRALQLRAATFRRQRVPNPTVSLFVQNDGFNEKVFGAGLALPIPLPGNVGQTYRGEIGESEALAQRVAADRTGVERALRLQAITALHSYDSRRSEVETFTKERLERAESSLRSLEQEVAAGRVAVRDAVIAQQASIEFLRAHVAARQAWCAASLELARAVGMPLEEGAP